MEHSETNNHHNDEGQKISETTEVKKVRFNNCLHIQLVIFIETQESFYSL